jgi:hypothetical protein
MMHHAMRRRLVHSRIAIALTALGVVATAVAPARAQVTYRTDVPIDTTRVSFLLSTPYTPLAQGETPNGGASPPPHLGLIFGIGPINRPSYFTYDTRTGEPLSPDPGIMPSIILDQSSHLAMYYEQGTATPGPRGYFFTALSQLIEYNFVTLTIQTSPIVDSMVQVYAMSASRHNGVALTGMDVDGFINGVNGGFFVDADTGAATPIFSLNGGSALGQFATDTRFLSYGPNGLLYVLDYGNNRVQGLDPTNGYAPVFAFTLSSSSPITNSQFSLDSAGNFYFGDGAGGGSVYDAAGNFVEAFSLPAGSYTAVGPGQAYTSATTDGTLLVYDPTGMHFYSLGAAAAAPEPSSLALPAVSLLAIAPAGTRLRVRTRRRTRRRNG